MKALITFIVLLAVAGFGLWDVYAPPPREIIRAPVVDDTPPGLTLPPVSFTDLDGTTHALEDFKGRTILINVWATWCAPCLIEFPDLLKIAQARANDLTLIALSVDADAALIPAFFNRLSGFDRALTDLPNVLIAHDPKKVIAQDILQTVRYPESYLLGPDLTVHRKIVGPLTEADIQSLLSAQN